MVEYYLEGREGGEGSVRPAGRRGRPWPGEMLLLQCSNSSQLASCVSHHTYRVLLVLSAISCEITPQNFINPSGWYGGTH
eukprot:scaffold40057_cov122-Skeletonema_dohrnii-CCMP3373.AAC.2